MMWVLAAAALVGNVALTAALAHGKGFNTPLWALAAVILPGLTLLAVILVPGVNRELLDTPPQVAVTRSPVAVALHRASGQNERMLAVALNLSRKEIRRQLAALSQLEMAVRSDDGRWELTDRGHQAFT